MRRLMLGLLAVAALSALALPVWGGREAQREFAEIQAWLRGSLPASAAIETRFERGWLCSRAETRIGAVWGEARLRHTIFHGPLPLGGIRQGVALWPPMRAVVISDWSPDAHADAGDAPWLRVHTRLALNGAVQMVVESPARGQGDALVWEGLQGGLVASEDGEILGALNGPHFALRSPAGWIEMRDFALAMELRTAEGGARVGTHAFSVGSLRGAGPAGAFALDALRWEQRTRSDDSDASYAVEWNAGFDGFTLGDDRTGPGALRLLLRRIDRDALDASLTALRETGEPDPEALVRLLKRSPEIVLERLQLAGPHGTLRAEGRAGINGNDPALAMGWLLAPMALEAHLDVRVSTRWLHRALDDAVRASLVDAQLMSDSERVVQAAALRTDWLRQALERGWLVREDADYRLQIELREADLLLNGRPLDAEAFEAVQRLRS